ncbi:7243_t:CDS:10 [Acaulospora colombiana]|uniref:7243_t:CDS:1 n=1 Tax=Acaulospora colombiana TaxID=27376 RepID=A0ACA9JXI5_9GLOM|nr:7243_t:CDS:10 [Acaulospora colombiana]
MSTTKKQPEWHIPASEETVSVLKLYNSLTRSKIILRARQNYLYNNLKSSTDALTSELIETVRTALNDFAKTKLGVIAGTPMATDKNDPKYLLHANAFSSRGYSSPSLIVHEYSLQRETVKAVAAAEVSLEDVDTGREVAHKLLDDSYEVIVAWLDKEKGASVTDPKIFRDLAAYWEKSYMEDMKALNVLPCDVLTRVSEYVPEIVEYVKKILENGYAYESYGSVYFDTNAFDGKDGHHYAKLEPWSTGNEKLIEEGEGSLGSKLAGKKNKSDFALWKKSKPGEPSWESPWGPGRPGWHIECSVMASEVLGENMDIHSGGIDLAFPHHDNELAQSEAYHGCHQWVNYFIHAGHLNLEGMKMSKSLKNFITIQEALEKYSPRQIRLFFLLHQWDAKIDFKDSSLVEAKSIETILNNFFVNAKALINEFKLSAYESDGKHRYRGPEKEIISLFLEKQRIIHAALCDSLNTPVVMLEIMDLVNKTNVYISAGRNSINVNAVELIARYVTKMLRIFGVMESTATEEIGFGTSEKQGISSNEKEDLILPYLRVLSGFRDNVRELARQKKAHEEFLLISDKLRDTELVDLGVSLDDQEDGKALVKLVDRDELIKSREERLRAQAEKAAKKEAAAKAKEEEKRKRLEQGKIDPEMMFKEAKDEEGKDLYSAFDEMGIPTHDNNGEELSKNRVKKLKKEWEVQKKLNAEYLDWKQKNVSEQT